jgi:hypothetical protein
MAERARARQPRVRPAPRPAAPRLNVVQPVPSDGFDDASVARDAENLLVDPRFGSAAAAQRLRLVQRLQSRQGNAFVARLVQRAPAAADAPADAPVAAPRPKLEPDQDPKFASVEQKVRQTSKQEKHHASAKSKVAEAQGAAVGPPNDVASQAAATQVDKMAQQKPGDFDKKAFIEAVKQAIEAAAPKNLEDADDFKSDDKPGQVKSQVSGLVGKGKQDSEAGIKQTNTEPPDASKAKPKVVTPMGDEKAGAAPGDVGANQAIPSPKTPAETSMAAGPAEVNQQMASADVTEDQLKKSNEPQFTDALGAKKTAEQNSQHGPEEYKATENQTLGKAGTDAKGAAATGLAGMHADKAKVLAGVMGNKGGAKTQDEAKRAEVASKIETIFNQTRTEVTAILDGLDGKVDSAFDAGEKAARDQFENYVDQKMTAYKDERYSGLLGKGRWLEDKLLGMPSEVNAFYADGRNQYLKQMEGVISRVADIVGAELGKAKKRIADGRQQVTDYVASQPKALQQVAKDAEQQISSKFDQLEGDVNSKQDALVQTLADKYVKARDSLDDRINQLKAENKGLVSAAIDAIGGVIQTIKQLKDMLLNVLQRAANVIGDIIKDPIKFLGNLVGAIKQGLNQFVSNIATHLKKGLMGWLFGTLGGAGLQLPDSFDLKGIVSLIVQILGLTYEHVRGIAIKLVGEKVVSAVEGTVKFFVTLAKDGPAGLWEWIKDKIDQINIKDMVIGAIKDFVITRIIVAGVTWLIGLLNPAAAFIKACKMIYDVIMFFIERGSQIMEFVNSILDGISAIVSGSIGSAASLVENSLAKILPLAISFLASLLGIDGIAEKIKEIIEKIRNPIDNLITAVVGPLLRPLKSLYDKGAKFVTGAIDKGKALGKKAIGKVKGVFGVKDKADKDAQPGPAAAPQDMVIEQSFAMGSASHQLRFVVADGQLKAPTMASTEGELLGKLRAQKTKEQTTIDDPATPEPERVNSRARKADIEGIETWFAAELGTIRSAPDKSKIRTQIQALAEDLKVRIVGFGQKWHLDDVVYATLGVPDLKAQIQGQVDQLRKHVDDARRRKPGVTGDGHSNSAAAAEALGWLHPSGQQHRDRALTAERVLEDALNQLDGLQARYGVTLSSLPEYQDGKLELADTKLCLSDPKGYLVGKSWDGKPLWDAFFPGRAP